MFDSIYHGMREDVRFAPIVVALPYSHGANLEGGVKDAGVVDFLKARDIPSVYGYEKDSKSWMMPTAFDSDYVFFQTPYPMFPEMWSVDRVSQIARVCYIPYATCLFRGVVDDTLHPASFYKKAWFEFMESIFSMRHFAERFQGEPWYSDQRVVVCGHPKLDYLTGKKVPGRSAWKRGEISDIRRVLWTPRWNTSEGTCTFFDYHEFLFRLFDGNLDLEFAFRPHPLCFSNFLKTGELDAESLGKLRLDYEASPNMVIDESGDYHQTFLTSDILISDISSMMLEFFAMGKPIIYTHKIDQFNELGRELAKGLYLVNNEDELKATLEMLLSGEDPLKQTRLEIMQTILHMPMDGAGMKIKDILWSDFQSAGQPVGEQL